MRWVILIAFGLLVGCGSKDEAGKGDAGPGDTGTASFEAAQAIVDQVAAKHDGLERLTLHAVPSGQDTCTQIASTMAARRGKPSDPEDLQALETGEEVVLDEDGALDVTIPIRMVDGKPTAVAGVTLAMEDGADRDALNAEAHAIAKELEAAIAAAGKPLW